jgi:hypothetical protein
MISKPEVFTADEAVELFQSYYTTGDIPSNYTLRHIETQPQTGLIFRSGSHGYDGLERLSITHQTLIRRRSGCRLCENIEVFHVPTGVFTKAWKGLQFWKQREANRSALLHGAIAAATYSGALDDQALYFAHWVIDASGPRPKGVSKKFKWAIGGGPPPNWPDWQEWVEFLGLAAYDKWFGGAGATAGWKPTKSREEFAKSYVLEVRNYLAKDKSNQTNIDVLNAANLASYLAEQARRDKLKRLTIVWSVLTAVVFGGAAGHLADVQAHLPLPDATAVGVTAAVCATVAAAFASRPKQSQTLAARAAQSDYLKNMQLEVRSPLRQVVDGLVKVVSSNLRAFPPGEGQLLTDTILTAVDLIHQGAEQTSGKVALTLSGEAREKIQLATEELVRTAEDRGLRTEDRVCMEHIQTLAKAVGIVTRLEDSPSSQGESSSAEAFCLALSAAWNVADHIEGRAAGSEPPAPVPVRLEREADL